MASGSDGPWAYDVFLSFRGEDTRNNFTAHLYTALRQKGINTFIDDDELKKGEEISPALLKAIEESRISIIVFSENYASSSWCLDELSKIRKCMEKKKQLVLPVFYKVDPSDVRHQNNDFGKAFAKLKDKVKDFLRMHRWREALHETANLAGYPLKINGNESEFVQSIVDMVSRTIVNREHLHVAKYPVGIESRVWDINLLLSIGLNDRRMVGIFGGGGIGKTTIAKAVYNSIAHQFEGSCLLENVREASKQEKGMVKLQKEMLSEILVDTRLKLGNVSRGICVIRERLSNKRVLIVLDDVDDLDQLDALAGSCDWFGLGSRIIITTRDQRLLTSHGIVLNYKVEELDCHEALQLFSCHAFNVKKPVDDNAELTKRVISYAGGLPLALKVLGSELCGKDEHYWKNALDKYERIPNKSIHKILKISYDGLDKNEKDIFLDIACFFKGNSVDYVTKILDSCGFRPNHGIIVLVDKCLITTDHNKLWMHDLVQEMGREIVQEESKEPGERSRLWFHEDVVRVLEENTGTYTVEGILVDLPKQDQDTIWLSSESFLKMRNLRLFIIRNAKFSGQLNYLPNHLRLIDWSNCPVESLPPNFHPKKLVVLRMRNCFIKQLDGFKKLQFMTIMDISECEYLTKIPDLSGIPNLENLNLSDCKNLVEVHNSVGFLEKLVDLVVKKCSNLRNFPRSLNSRSLERLILDGCSRLENFPEIPSSVEFLSLQSPTKSNFLFALSCFSTLEHLDLSKSNLVSIPACINRFVELKWLVLRNCKQLQEILHLPPNIVRLRVEGCISLERISEVPSGSGFIPWLDIIDLSGCHKLIGKIENAAGNLLLREVCGGDRPIIFIYPGNKIPDWFSHRQEASNPEKCHIDIEEPLDLNGEIKGMVVCAVFKMKDGAAEKEEVQDEDGAFHNSLRYSVKIRYKEEVQDEEFNDLGRWWYTIDIPRSDHVWLYYVPEKYNELKRKCRRVEFSIRERDPFSIKSCGVHLVCRYDGKAKEIVNQYTNPPQDQENDGVDFPLDVPNEDIRNLVVTKRRRDDNLESIPYPQQKIRCASASIPEVEETPLGESQEESSYPLAPTIRVIFNLNFCDDDDDDDDDELSYSSGYEF